MGIEGPHSLHQDWEPLRLRSLKPIQYQSGLPCLRRMEPLIKKESGGRGYIVLCGQIPGAGFQGRGWIQFPGGSNHLTPNLTRPPSQSRVSPQTACNFSYRIQIKATSNPYNSLNPLTWSESPWNGDFLGLKDWNLTEIFNGNLMATWKKKRAKIGFWGRKNGWEKDLIITFQKTFNNLLKG